MLLAYPPPVGRTNARSQMAIAFRQDCWIHVDRVGATDTILGGLGKSANSVRVNFSENDLSVCRDINAE